jgi:polar amino acid transport system ATP-binding protein
MTEGEPLLKIRKLAKRYGDNLVLDGINLDVFPGDDVSIIGRSGSGKSTLLRCIQLLEEFDFELITLNGKPFGYRERNGKVMKLKGKDLARERSQVGMVFQSFNLFPHMTVLENIVEAPIHVKGLSREESIDRAMDLLKRIRLQNKAGSYPAGLSGGQQQRVAIVRALAMNPTLMLFDEPTSALDPELVKGVLDLMAEIAEEGMTMIVVTHEMPFALNVSTRVVFIDKGKVVEEGSPHQVIKDPQHPETRLFLDSLLL